MLLIRSHFFKLCISYSMTLNPEDLFSIFSRASPRQDWKTACLFSTDVPSFHNECNGHFPLRLLPRCPTDLNIGPCPSFREHAKLLLMSHYGNMPACFTVPGDHKLGGCDWKIITSRKWPWGMWSNNILMWFHGQNISISMEAGEIKPHITTFPSQGTQNTVCGTPMAVNTDWEKYWISKIAMFKY